MGHLTGKLTNRLTGARRPVARIRRLKRAVFVRMIELDLTPDDLLPPGVLVSQTRVDTSQKVLP